MPIPRIALTSHPRHSRRHKREQVSRHAILTRAFAVSLGTTWKSCNGANPEVRFKAAVRRHRQFQRSESSLWRDVAGPIRAEHAAVSRLRQASVGIVSLVAGPHFGQLIVDCGIGVMSPTQPSGYARLGSWGEPVRCPRSAATLARIAMKAPHSTKTHKA